MSDQTSRRLVAAIEQLRELYPGWRIGQLVANVASWARDPTPEAVWEVTDEEFVAAAESHLQHRRADAAASATKKAV